jgi:hypothetical protein
VHNPIRLGVVVIAAMAMALPAVSQAQDSGQVTKAALTVSQPDMHVHHQPRNTDVAPHARKSEHATKTEKHARKSTATARAHARVSRNTVPRSTFEQRTAHYFDPLSLTLAPENRIDPVKSQYNQVTDSFTPPDKALIATTPDDAASTQISSASIEQMGKGNNHTLVVPLFQILNSLSPAPPAQ